MTSSHKNDFERTLGIIEYKILSGILNPRERLIERELTEEYKISTGTVRKILKELVVKNLARHIPNKGAVVTEPTRKEVEDIYHTRVLLEGHALENVIVNMDNVQLKLIETHEINFEKGLKDKNPRGILKYNRLFHQAIFETCGNAIISEMIDQMRNRSRIWYYYMRGNAQHLERSVADHRKMISCLRSRDIVELKRINNDHLSIGYTMYKKDLIIT